MTLIIQLVFIAAVCKASMLRPWKMLNELCVNCQAFNIIKRLNVVASILLHCMEGRFKDDVSI